MLYRNVPKTNDALSILGYGCMRFPERFGSIDEKRSTALLRTAIDNGVNYLDTAWLYHNGQSEAFVGRALKDGYRSKVRLATKLPQWLVKNRVDMDVFLDMQLERLQTDIIDYYLLHSLDNDSWHRLLDCGVLDFLDAAKADKRIRYAGFSFHDNTASFKKIVDAYDWEFCQIQYNIIDEHSQAGREGLLYAAEKNLAVFIMEPLLGGKLGTDLPGDVRKIYQEAEIKRTPAQWALLWLWDHPQITVVLSGMNSEKHLQENLQTASIACPDALTTGEHLVIRQAADTYRSRVKIPCTGCGYCMPCPFGVDIPLCFELYNRRFMFDDHRHTWFTYAGRAGAAFRPSRGASLCRGCNTCVSSCPQHIPIPDVLKDVAGEFEGIKYRLFVAIARIGIPLIRILTLFYQRLHNRV
ncbi:MAG: aldo/keto reductase [Methanospirillaceae archaeon]|nr:aldo/keto reductase [Methanospirillaceae archaeon]